MRLLTEAEVAERLHVSQTTVNRLMKLPGFPVVRVPKAHRVLIPEEWLQEWLRKQANAPQE